MDKPVITQTFGNVMVITINRPEVRNAIDSRVFHGLGDAANELDERSDLAVGVLTGAGGTFCSGMDLKAYSAGNFGSGGRNLTADPPTKPLIAAVEGWALAGGCELALACDLVVAAENATFGLPEVTRGLIASGGGLLRLPKTVPYRIAMEIALTGAHFTAELACRYGLVNRLTPPGSALEEARRLAETISMNAPLAIRATKAVIRDSAGWTDASAWAAQAPVAAAIFDSDDAREGARAFVEKRTPQWSER
ncbi:crotonase/enoyl-CoA hydratase family protein [Nocardia cerradoensis]|uniref:Carnitinyl-CoA dehydratase n=1 Tax=Nocardia cerradoensis TaxID=85688 RepID=A0A231GUZ4_9NOCA|nr:crotonase/enoyl-CoA hydratase family protein [Nocardia cerradoensis]NKY43622.1 crotonase/enoyl-CoA hydratase family protein [Nocardia cerradoensis]OXR40449.1 Carnitinyl-CoA dehydratase [Nocardia cerradoensis]